MPLSAPRRDQGSQRGQKATCSKGGRARCLKKGQNRIFSGLFRTGSQGVPNWLAKCSELARSAFRTGSQKHQNQLVPNWLAIFTFSKVADLSRARAKEPVQNTPRVPNWLEREELGT